METPKAQVRVPATMSEKFFWLKAILRDTDLSASAKNVAAALMTFHNDRTGQCNPSQKRLAEAVGLSRMRVNRLVAELRVGGWIEAENTLGASNYRLALSRAGSAIASGECVETETAPVSDLKQGCVESGTGGVSDLKYPCVESGTQNHTGNDQEEPLRGTTQPNLTPAAVAIEPVEPEAVGPAIAHSAMPDQPETKLPVPANDDTPGLGVVRISGLEIPEATFLDWETSFRDIDLRASILSRAKWAAGLSEKRPGHRMRALQTELAKLNDKARQERLSRQENRKADAEAGIERDPFYGRPIRKAKLGWIENPRARPDGEGRYWIPPAPGTEIVFRGKGWSLSQAKLDEGETRWPAIDFRAAVTAFDSDHASAQASENENRSKLVAFLDARQGEAMAA